MREVTARVFLEGGKRAIKLAAPDTDAVMTQYRSALVGDGDPILSGVTVEGEPFVCDAHRVVDILGPSSEDEVTPDPGIFDGRRITLRDYAAFVREERSRGETVFYTDYGQPAVAVLGEDMAEVLLAVVTVAGESLWANPASAPGADVRYAQVVRLAAEAETAQQDEDRANYGPGREASSYEESENAQTAATDLVGDNPA